MLKYIDFAGIQMKPLLFNLINQTILPFDNSSMDISVGDKFRISFDNIPFKNYFIFVTGVTITNFSNISNKDMFNCGFLYRPSFNSYMKKYKKIESNDSIVKLDFKVMEIDCYD